MSSRTRKAKTHRGAARSDPRWAAVAARDPRADGRFVYAVRTTGVGFTKSSTGAPSASSASSVSVTVCSGRAASQGPT